MKIFWSRVAYLLQENLNILRWVKTKCEYRYPIPSESTTNMLQSRPSLVFPLIGVPQTHNPLNDICISFNKSKAMKPWCRRWWSKKRNKLNDMIYIVTDPTPNPSALSNSILFNKNDFPVLYIPATPIIPRGLGMVLIISKVDWSSPYSIWKWLVSYIN